MPILLFLKIYQRISELFRLEGISWYFLVQPPYSCRVSYSRLSRNMSGWVLLISTGEAHKLSGQSKTVFEHPCSKRGFVFPIFLICAHCLFSGPWTCLRSAWFPFFVASHQAFINKGKSLLNLFLSRMNSPCLLRFFIYGRCSSPFIILVALCFLLFYLDFLRPKLLLPTVIHKAAVLSLKYHCLLSSY